MLSSSRLAEQLDNYTHFAFWMEALVSNSALTTGAIARFDMETCQSGLFKTLNLRSKLIYSKANLCSHGDEVVSLLLPDLMLNLKTGPSWFAFLKPILEK